MKIEGYKNYIITCSGDVINTNTGRTLKNQVNNCGYHRVQLSKSGGTKRMFVHRLVATAYIDNADNLPQVNHIDGDKLNNAVRNLEWCTASANHKHSFRYLGRQVTRVYDSDNGKTKIRKDEIPALIERKKSMTYRALALEVGVNPKYLALLLKGQVRV